MAFPSPVLPELFSPELYDPINYQPSHMNRNLGLIDNLINRPARNQLVIRPIRHTSGNISAVKSVLAKDPNKYRLMVNVKHFKPEELSVKTIDNHIVIHAKHEETADEHGFVSREFTRRYALPEGVESRNVCSALSQDGVLTIQAPKKAFQRPRKNERVVPITMQQPASTQDQQKQLQQEQSEESK